MDTLTAIAPLAALGAAIFIGWRRQVNIGLLSIAGAFLTGQFLAGLEPRQIVTGWPLSLFFMLLGMTFLFGIAGLNGTLSLIARKAVAATRGRRRLIPLVFFFVPGLLAALGPGNIAVCALVLPLALAVAHEENIPPLLMTALVIAGANAGGLSPIAPTGVIGATLAREVGLDIAGRIFYRQVIGQGIMAGTLYFLLGGHRLARRPAHTSAGERFDRNQRLTLLVLLLVIGAILFGRLDIGLTAFSGALVLLLCGAAREEKAFLAVPWATLVLVCGVGMLVNVAGHTGGIETLTRFLAGIMNAHTAGPTMAVIGGLLSIVSSASGVVMPTLIPTAPGLAAEIGTDATHIISAVIMGAHVVTTSPISTLGALAMSAAGRQVNRLRLFNQLFIVAIAGLFYAALLSFLRLV